MKLLFTILAAFQFNFLLAQNTGIIDTVSYARNLAYDKKFEEAEQLLSNYNNNHNDVNALRLHAQILYWMKRNDDAKAVYEKTLSLFPSEASVKLDYGRFLFQINKYSKARPLLTDYIIYDSKNAEAISMLAYIDLWTGHLAAAKKKADLLDQLYPGNGDAATIYQEIKNYTTAYLKLQGNYYSDDQPMSGWRFEPEFGVYKSWLFSPYIKAKLQNFDAGDTYKTSWIEAGNKISIAATKTDLDLSAGYFQGSNYDGDASWKVKLTQKLFTGLSMEGSSEKKPYQYTLASINNPFLFQLAEIGLNLDYKNRWLGKAAYQNQHFDDGNNSHTSYAWLLAPIIHKTNFSLKIGYSFSYADADSNRYIPKDPLSFPHVLNAEVEGVYSPYFTPSDQMTHALLAYLQIPFSKNVVFTSNINVGIKATASHPYLFVDKTGATFFINKSYYDLSYTPAEISCALQCKLSKSLMITGNYLYSSLIFFKSNTAGIQLKYLFIHDKKK
jgi:hypothetical protein